MIQLPDVSEIKIKNLYVINNMIFRCTKHIENFKPGHREFKKHATLKHTVDINYILYLCMDCGSDRIEPDTYYYSAKLNHKKPGSSQVGIYSNSNFGTIEDCLLDVCEHLLHMSTNMGGYNVKSRIADAELLLKGLTELQDLHNIKDILE